jgi:hypothetical protein
MMYYWARAADWSDSGVVKLAVKGGRPVLYIQVSQGTDARMLLTSIALKPGILFSTKNSQV